MFSMPTFFRQPSFFERFYICRANNARSIRGFNVFVKLNRPVTHELLSNALRTLILSDPMFSVNATNNGDGQADFQSRDQDRRANGYNYRVGAVSEIRYDDVVSWTQVSRFDESCLRQLSLVSIPVNTNLPSWRLQVFEEEGGAQYVVFISNHIFFDGRSGAYALQDLTKALSEAKAEHKLEVLFNRETDAVPVSPSSDTLTGLFKVSVWKSICKLAGIIFVPSFVKKFFNSYFNPELPNFYKYPPFNLVKDQSFAEGSFKTVRFQSQELSTMLAGCKKLGVALTPFMSSCFYKAVEDVYTPALGPFSQNCSMVIDGRRYHPELEKETRYGLFVAVENIFFQPGSSIAEASLLVSQKIKSALQSRLAFGSVGLLRRWINIWDFVESSFDNKKGTFEVSNLGAMPITAGDWRAEDVGFSQGSNSTHFTLSAVSSAGGLNLTVSYPDCIDEALVDKCLERFSQHVMSL